jgi:hypothetical protein
MNAPNTNIPGNKPTMSNIIMKPNVINSIIGPNLTNPNKMINTLNTNNNPLMASWPSTQQENFAKTVANHAHSPPLSASSTSSQPQQNFVQHSHHHSTGSIQSNSSASSTPSPHLNSNIGNINNNMMIGNHMAHMHQHTNPPNNGYNYFGMNANPNHPIGSFNALKQQQHMMVTNQTGPFRMTPGTNANPMLANSYMNQFPLNSNNNNGFGLNVSSNNPAVQSLYSPFNTNTNILSTQQQPSSVGTILPSAAANNPMMTQHQPLLPNPIMRTNSNVIGSGVISAPSQPPYSKQQANPNGSGGFINRQNYE